MVNPVNEPVINQPDKGRESSAQRAYQQLRQMAMTFQIRPDERVNEVELAERLEISRTPIREALNRLVAEGLLVTHSRGFSARKLIPKEVADLYEARAEVEATIVRLACVRVSDDDLARLEKFVTESIAEREEAGIDRLVQLDVAFHEHLALLSRNDELLRVLRSINDRIYFIRWINMDGRRKTTQGEHWKVFELLKRRDAASAEEQLRKHILLRNDQILEVIKKAYTHIYTAHMSEL